MNKVYAAKPVNDLVPVLSELFWASEFLFSTGLLLIKFLVSKASISTGDIWNSESKLNTIKIRKYWGFVSFFFSLNHMLAGDFLVATSMKMSAAEIIWNSWLIFHINLDSEHVFFLNAYYLRPSLFFLILLQSGNAGHYFFFFTFPGVDLFSKFVSSITSSCFGCT